MTLPGRALGQLLLVTTSASARSREDGGLLGAPAARRYRSCMPPSTRSLCAAVWSQSYYGVVLRPGRACFYATCSYRSRRALGLHRTRESRRSVLDSKNAIVLGIRVSAMAVDEDAVGSLAETTVLLLSTDE